MTKAFQYAAFIDVLGFSEYIATNITNDNKAKDFKEEFEQVVGYMEHEVGMNNFENAQKIMESQQLTYAWVSDTFVINIRYPADDLVENINKVKTMMLFRLTMVIASIHHFMAMNFGLLVRGGISDKIALHKSIFRQR